MTHPERFLPRLGWFSAIMIGGAGALGFAADSGPGLALAGPAAAVTRLQFEGQAVPLQAGGGFAVVDFATGVAARVATHAVDPEGAGFRYQATGSGVRLRAKFVPSGGFVEVTGEIESQEPRDRALLVRYTVPVPGNGAVYSNTLSQAATIAPDRKELGTIFPVAAMTGDDWGVALAIPPDFPSCFGMAGSSAGLAVEFYLGVSPDVRAFPNRAAFRFLIGRADAGWGFRSALANYYARFPDYYRPRYQGAGFWNWNDPAGLGDEQSVVNEALPLYKAHGFTRGALFAKQVARNQRHGIVSFAYTIVGMRELTGLPELPADYEEAMKVFGEFERSWKAEGPHGPLHKKHAGNNERNRELPAQILNSTVQEADGRHRLRIRHSVWGANSVTFVENPNPDLFNDRPGHTVGAVTLQMLREWLADDGVPGVHLDSLGSQWPSCVNYRRDHFRYARYPLTFDRQGRVALHNAVSHFEFVEEVRALARRHNKLVFGNGIDIYESRAMAEHYQGVKNGRFFLAALLDMAGREITDDLLNRERLEAFRTCLGPKLMTAILYKWRDQRTVREQMNRALVYDVFTAPNRFFEDKISYLAAPDGYARDRELLAWFSKHARTLHNARWQPVTHARVSGGDVACERYGTGDVFYFAVVNLGPAAADCELKVDMAALKIAPGEGASSSFSEVARGARIRVATERGTGRVQLQLEPDEAQIVKLSRTW